MVHCCMASFRVKTVSGVEAFFVTRLVLKQLKDELSFFTCK